MEKPPIRILQRPFQAECDKSDLRKAPVICRTLEEKTADYAAARQRIMGSDSPVPDEVDVFEEPKIEKQRISEVILPGKVNCSDYVLSSESTPDLCRWLQDTEIGHQTDVPTSIFSAASYTNSTPYSCFTPSVNQNMTSVNAGNNKPRHQSSSKMSRQQRSQLPQQKAPTTRIAGSASSPSLLGPSSVRNNKPPPLFPPQMSNVGLLPTPKVNVPLQTNMDVGGCNLHQSQSAAAMLAMMNPFTLLQQQQQQQHYYPMTTLPTGIQHNNQHHHHPQSVAPVNSSFGLPMGFPLVPTYPSVNHQRFSHQPTFN